MERITERHLGAAIRSATVNKFSLAPSGPAHALCASASPEMVNAPTRVAEPRGSREPPDDVQDIECNIAPSSLIPAGLIDQAPGATEVATSSTRSAKSSPTPSTRTLGPAPLMVAANPA